MSMSGNPNTSSVRFANPPAVHPRPRMYSFYTGAKVSALISAANDDSSDDVSATDAESAVLGETEYDDMWIDPSNLLEDSEWHNARDLEEFSDDDIPPLEDAHMEEIETLPEFSPVVTSQYQFRAFCKSHSYSCHWHPRSCTGGWQLAELNE